MYLFSITGTLVSLSGTRNVKAAQEFSVESLDGVLECIYWEMEGCFPALTQGRLVRVVGRWDVGTKRLQCFSVRQTKTAENEGTVRQCVSLADRHMTKLVGRIAYSGH